MGKNINLSGEVIHGLLVVTAAGNLLDLILLDPLESDSIPQSHSNLIRGTNLILPWVPPHCFTAISVPWAAFHFFQKVTYRGVIYIQ